MEWYIKVVKQYTDFKGRARRKEYWMFTLVNAIIVLSISLTEVFIRGKSIFAEGASLVTVFLLLLYGLFVLVPSIAVTVRRLHDTGRSGWWYLISIIPYLGALVILFLWPQIVNRVKINMGLIPKALLVSLLILIDSTINPNYSSRPIGMNNSD